MWRNQNTHSYIAGGNVKSRMGEKQIFCYAKIHIQPNVYIGHKLL